MAILSDYNINKLLVLVVLSICGFPGPLDRYADRVEQRVKAGM